MTVPYLCDDVGVITSSVLYLNVNATQLLNYETKMWSGIHQNTGHLDVWRWLTVNRSAEGGASCSFFRILATPKISGKAVAQFLKSRKNCNLSTYAEKGGGKVRNSRYISPQLISDTHPSQPNSRTYKYTVIPVDS